MQLIPCNVLIFGFCCLLCFGVMVCCCITFHLPILVFGAVSWEYLGINSCGTKRLPLSLVSPPCRTSSIADVQPSLDSKARRGSACPQGAPQLHQPISWTPDLSWRRRPGRPRGRWIAQLRRDNS